MIKIKPIKNRVLVEPFKPEEKTSSGLFIPASPNQKQQRGVVIAVGDGRQGEIMTVKEGQTVAFGRNAGIEFSFEDKDYLMMTEDEIFAVIN